MRRRNRPSRARRRAPDAGSGGPRKRRRASVAYTVAALALVGVAAFLAVSFYGLFEEGGSREAPTTVLVLNGCGAEGIGLAATKLLRAHGIDVVNFRNAPRLDYAETIVIDRSGDTGLALEIGRLLKTGNVVQQIPDTPLEDVVVILGRDHERYLGKGAAPEGS